jgi:light-regulated signal transduction histidine kinase (bacteriophytochrome)
MVDKELHRLSRAELIEMLLEQSKRVASLERQLEETEEKLRDREIILSETGNIAEAALKLNGVFEAAQAASEQYIQGVKSMLIREKGADSRMIDEVQITNNKAV